MFAELIASVFPRDVVLVDALLPELRREGAPLFADIAAKWDAIQSALEKDRVRRKKEAEIEVLQKRIESLTPREREVLAMVVLGTLNKQIAARIGTTENTVKVQRSRVMKKMQARSLADLVRMVERIPSGKTL